MKAILYLVLFAAFWIQPASAEFYRYVDKHGNVLYTDDLSKVPADRRPSATPYAEAMGQPAPAVKGEEAGRAAHGAMEEERKQLEQQEKDLNLEYEQLVKDRNTLDKEKEQAVTPDQIRTYNQKIVDFNARIQGYEQKRGIYTEKAKAFNDRLKDTPPAPETKQ